jgi:protoporphyrinogen oxidase
VEPPDRHIPVAILGAGLTGMSCAHRLREAGVAYRLYERLDQPGGHAVTVEEAGYRFDRTGHLLHVEDEALRVATLGWLGEDARWIERNSVVYSHGGFRPYPFQAHTHGLPPAVAYDCVMGFIAAQREPVDQPIETFEAYCRAYFGEGFTRHFMVPYNERLWGVPAREITAAWCERFVPRPNLEDVIAGAVGQPVRAMGYNRRFLYPARGIGRLSEGMAAELGDALRLGMAPRRIAWRERQLWFGDEAIHYDKLVSTIPLPTLVGLCDEVPAAVRAAAARLRWTSLSYLDVALRRQPTLPYHWVYVPEAHYPFYRVGCYTNFSDAMAPPGAGSLYVELCARKVELDDVWPSVRDALIEMGWIASQHDVAFTRLRRIEHAYVIYDRHHETARDQVLSFLAQAGIVSAGRYGGWNYSSMGDALRFGREAADRAMALEGAA